MGITTILGLDNPSGSLTATYDGKLQIIVVKIAVLIGSHLTNTRET